MFPPSKEFSQKAHIKSMKEYEQLYKRSVDDPDKFWAEMAEKNLTWFKKWDKVLEYDFNKPFIKWFSGGKLNASVNCLDRFINTPTRNKAAIIWEADGGTYQTFTYQQLYYEVNRFANVLKKKGIKKGDRITIYLPMIPELADLHAGLRSDRRDPQRGVRRVLREVAAWTAYRTVRRQMVITADEGVRGGRFVPLKANADDALNECPTVKNVIVVQRAGTGKVNMEPSRDTWWHDEMNAADMAELLRAREDGRGRPALHPLYIGFHGQAQGRAAYHGRVHALHEPHVQVDFRLP